MKRTALVLVLVLSLFVGGCAGHGRWFVDYDSGDNVGEVTGKTLLNIGLGTMYIAGSLIFITAWLVIDSESHDAEYECSSCHRHRCVCER